MKGLSGCHAGDYPKDISLPLWRRTQLSLPRMETWSAQHRNTPDGFTERIQLQDQRIAPASQHIVLLLKDWEEGRH